MSNSTNDTRPPVQEAEQPEDLPQDSAQQAREEVHFDEPIASPEPSSASPGRDDSVDSLKQELAAAEGRALRAYADLDNYKKRFERELARQRDVERERFLNEVLSIADNLRRALRVPGAEDSPYRDGLLSVLRQIENMLRDFGVAPIAAEKGQIMDPNLHEAVTALSLPGAEHESILEIVDPGYTIGERVLRPARVVVARSEDGD